MFAREVSANGKTGTTMPYAYQDYQYDDHSISEGSIAYEDVCEHCSGDDDNDERLRASKLQEDRRFRLRAKKPSQHIDVKVRVPTTRVKISSLPKRYHRKKVFSIVGSRIGICHRILVDCLFEIACGRRRWRYFGSSNGEVTTTAVRPHFGALWSMATPQFVYAMTGMGEKNIVALTWCGSRLRLAWSEELWWSARVPTSLASQRSHPFFGRGSNSIQQWHSSCSA